MTRMRPRQFVRINKSVTPGMAQVPIQLKVAQTMRYPADNHTTFERWYMTVYAAQDATDRIYLPIQWTALYCNNKFGKCIQTLQGIQRFLSTLDKSKKYYTIIQYDDGILNDLTDLDIKVFAMSGPRVDYPLPLLCQPHKYQFPNCKKDILASFVGRVTHPIRAAMIKQLQGLPGYYISTEPHTIEKYCHILARSKYALCPRGYGQTSFRICEAVQYGAVPVYISDGDVLNYSDFIIPYDALGMFPVCHALDIAKLHNQVHQLSNYEQMVENLTHYAPAFTYTGCKKMILKELKNEVSANIL